MLERVVAVKRVKASLQVAQLHHSSKWPRFSWDKLILLQYHLLSYFLSLSIQLQTSIHFAVELSDQDWLNLTLGWYATIEHFSTIIHPWVSRSYLACCLLGDPTDDPLDALHPHLELHQALLVAPHIVSTCLSQVATNPRSTSRSLGLAPCPCPHLQLLAFLVSQLTARHICTHPPPPPCLSFPLTPLPKPP